MCTRNNIHTLCRAFVHIGVLITLIFVLLPHDTAASGYPAFPAVPYLTIPQSFVGRRLNFPNPPIYAATVSLDAVNKFNEYRMDYLYAHPTIDEGASTEPPGKKCFVELDREVEGTCIPRTELNRCAGGTADLSPACAATTEVCCVFHPVDERAKGKGSKHKRQFQDRDVGIKNHGVHPKFLKDQER